MLSALALGRAGVRRQRRDDANNCCAVARGPAARRCSTCAAAATSDSARRRRLGTCAARRPSATRARAGASVRHCLPHRVDAAGVAYNLSDFEIYVSCGGRRSTTPWCRPRSADMAWQKMTVEPFRGRGTTPYSRPTIRRSPTFAPFRPTCCRRRAQNHVTVRDRPSGRDADNATKVRWGAVLDGARAFTAEELFLAPTRAALRRRVERARRHAVEVFLFALALLLVWRAVAVFLRTWPSWRCCPRRLPRPHAGHPALPVVDARATRQAQGEAVRIRDERGVLPGFGRGRRVCRGRCCTSCRALVRHGGDRDGRCDRASGLVGVDRGFYVGIFLVFSSQGLLLLLVWIINAILYRDRVRKMNYAFQDCLPFCDHGIPGERGWRRLRARLRSCSPRRMQAVTLYCVACWT